MTNDQFKYLVELNFKNQSQAATGLGLDRDTIRACVTGKTRKGAEFDIPLRIELALYGYIARNCRDHVVGEAEVAERKEGRESAPDYELYHNGMISKFSPNLWFGEQTAEFEAVKNIAPRYAALAISSILGCPARVLDSGWVKS